LSTPIAVVAALAAALVMGISVVADQLSTKRVRHRRALSPRILADLARQPLWLAAIGANVAGFALQVVALDNGSLALVQPILVGDLVFASLIAWYLERASVPPPVERRMFAGVIATTVGVAGFLATGQPLGGRTQVSVGVLPPLAAGLFVLVGGCLVVAARSRNLRPLALALACGVSYGVAAALTKLVTSEFGGGPARVLTSWPIYAFAVVGPAGFILGQNALQEGRFLAPVQSIISAADPIVSIAVGIAWLGVRLRATPGAIAGEVVSLMLMTAGIILIAHHTPTCGPKAKVRKAQVPQGALTFRWRRGP
jgi:hypothetical protein